MFLNSTLREYRVLSARDSWKNAKKYKIQDCPRENAVTVALNHEKIGKHPERILNIKPFIKPFIDKHNWEQ